MPTQRKIYLICSYKWGIDQVSLMLENKQVSTQCKHTVRTQKYNKFCLH